jgi:IclR family pca regulon transcriptional regulator
MAVRGEPAKRAAKSGSAEDAIDPRYIVPGLTRGLALLALFTRKRPAQSLAELAAGLALSRSAVYRLVYTLEKEGFLSREANSRQYRLTSRVLTLGFEYLNARGVLEIAEPILRGLSDKTSAASYIVQLDGSNAVYLARAMPAAGLVSNLQVGARLPAHATASGRILIAQKRGEELQRIFTMLRRDSSIVPPPKSLAELQALTEQDRKRGHVFHRSLINPGVVSFACPVRGKNGVISAAITVIGPEQLFSALGGEKPLAKIVSEAARAVSQRLGYVER